MNEIKIFQNPVFGEIRTQISASGEPLLCLVDVARALGYANPAKAVIDHCKGLLFWKPLLTEVFNKSNLARRVSCTD